MLRRFDVDWAGLGFSDADIDELSEHLLRIIQSFVIDPGRPPRQGDELRAYLQAMGRCGYATVGEPTIKPPSAEPTIKPPSAAETSVPRTPTTRRR